MRHQNTSEKKLFEIVESQQGLFTAKQAEEAGFIRTNHAYHVKAGHWIREERGVYRLSLFPVQDDQQLVTYALWSKNREGQIRGVYSHETALNHYDLSDLNPSKIHMTVPNNFRRHGQTPKVLKLYYANLGKEEIQMTRGFYVTKPLRTIHDVIVVQKTSHEFIIQAIDQGIKRGLFSKSDIKRLVDSVDVNSTARDSLKANLKGVAS